MSVKDTELNRQLWTSLSTFTGICEGCHKYIYVNNFSRGCKATEYDKNSKYLAAKPPYVITVCLFWPPLLTDEMKNSTISAKITS